MHPRVCVSLIYLLPHQHQIHPPYSAWGCWPSEPANCLSQTLGPAGFRLGSASGRPWQEGKAGGGEKRLPPCFQLLYVQLQWQWPAPALLSSRVLSSVGALPLRPHSSPAVHTAVRAQLPDSSPTEHPQVKLYPQNAGDKPGVSPQTSAPDMQHPSLGRSKH